MEDDVIVLEQIEQLSTEENNYEAEINLSLEYNTDVVEVDASTEDNTVLETLDTIEVSPISNDNIELDVAFPALGEPINRTDHDDLSGRTKANQHPISAITGLQPRLEELERLKSVYSDKENIAQYYYWHDGNPNDNDRSGYFVALKQGTNNIEISDENIIGVTVSSEDASFISNESTTARDDSYGLVCLNGVVKVHAPSNVSAGDKVVPDVNGYVKTSSNDYGYNVISITNEDGDRYAVIALVPQTIDIVNFKDDIEELDAKLDIVQSNTVEAINTANQSLDTRLSGQINAISTIANNASNIASSAQTAASNAGQAAAIAQSIATATQATVEGIQSTVTTNLSNIVEDITELTESVEPLTTWTYNGNTGAEYLINHIQNDLSTKTEISTLESTIGDAFTAMSRNARGTQTTVHEINYYFVGGHSPSYGLLLSEARDMLQENIVYVPVEDVVESYADEETSFTFSRGNSYKWEEVDDELTWNEYVENVGFSDTYITGSAQINYWYTGENVTHNNITYPEGSLSHWVDGAWVIVANIKNANSAWVTSRVYQTANAVGKEIADANGNIAALEMRVSGEGSAIRSLVTYGDVLSMMESVANADGVTTQDVALYEGKSLLQVLDMNESPTGSEFYETMPEWDDENDRWVFASTYRETPIDECYAKVTGHNEQFYKYNVFKNVWTRRTYGHTDGFVAGIFKTANETGSGISINANTIAINSDHFTVTPGGSIFSTSGTIGGFTIGASSISSNGKSNYNDNTNGVYIGTSGIGLGAGKFYVTSAGQLHAEDVNVEGTINATQLKINGKLINTANLLNADENGNLHIGNMQIDGTTGTISFIGQTIGSDYDNTDVRTYLDNKYNITWTTIGQAIIKSPKIQANAFEVHPIASNQYGGSFDIYGYTIYSDDLWHFYSVQYDGNSNSPQVTTSSPNGAKMIFKGVHLQGTTWSPNTWIESQVVLEEGKTYGTLTQRNALTYKEAGQLFFVIS